MINTIYDHILQHDFRTYTRKILKEKGDCTGSIVIIVLQAIAIFT